MREFEHFMRQFSMSKIGKSPNIELIEMPDTLNEHESEEVVSKFD